ncbi:hypothetical protein BWK59_03560 [Flavobacterium davisii]|uniref:Uncharacterized protein n=1 Tax=Flavobacterium davisii TaxID=2906077 RepID=A0A246GKB9_9FLAO|nr:hypothetical protein [Flavobacterium davisii]OWP84755.1 hypothetical protein BWK59_03560 [Flavobacterium davisii]
MVSLKNLSKLRANSILESVVALCIISICLYIAMVVFSVVLSPKASPKFYNTQHKVNELFYLAQVNSDSFHTQAEEIDIEEEMATGQVKQWKVTYKDSTNQIFEKQFYLINEEE